MPRILAILAAAILAFAATPARSALFTYEAILSGPAESPPNASPGFGTAILVYDDTALTFTYDVDFAGLLGTTTAAHVHCCTTTPGLLTAGVATSVPSFPGFPLGVTAGSWDAVVDLTAAASYNPAYITANGGTVASARAALLAGLDDGRAYYNIHSSVFGGGEIRGFFDEVTTPEPATAALLGAGLLALAAVRRRRS